MKLLYLLSVFYYFLYILNLHETSGATTNDTVTEIDPTNSYCFRFTWLGPEYDNTTNYNGTCDDYLNNTNAAGVPCRQPIVVTYDGTPPDIDYLWENYDTSVICRRARGYVCVKYSYIYNSEVQNITYMCSKVYAVDEGAVTSGCYQQTVDGYDIEMCVCESQTGGYKPCNAGMLHYISLHSVVLIILFNCLINCL